MRVDKLLGDARRIEDTIELLKRQRHSISRSFKAIFTESSN